MSAAVVTQQIYRLASASRADVCVDLGRLERLVAEERLDDAQVGAAVEELGRKGVAEDMRVKPDAKATAGARDSIDDRPLADSSPVRTQRAGRSRSTALARRDRRPPPLWRRCGGARCDPCSPCPEPADCAIRGNSRRCWPRSPRLAGGRRRPGAPGWRDPGGGARWPRRLRPGATRARAEDGAHASVR